jgi:hypothetical protein
MGSVLHATGAHIMTYSAEQEDSPAFKGLSLATPTSKTRYRKITVVLPREFASNQISELGGCPFSFHRR